MIIKKKEINIFYNSIKFKNLFYLIKKLTLILLFFFILISKKKNQMINIINNFKRYKKKFDYKIKKNRKNLSFNHNHFKNLDKNNSYGINVLICAITKQENLYLEEFIEYYVSLGIKKIILYDNNDLDDENINDLLLNKTLFQDFIDIIDYRGIKYAQKKAYNDCYNNNKNKYDWIAFFDIDEFLYLKGFQNINKFLSLSRFKKCSSILINWKYYGDNEFIYYEPKPLKFRFTKAFKFPKNQIINIYIYAAAKSIIKGGLNITWNHFPHFLNSSTICRPNGSIVSNPLSHPNYNNAFIKHYTTKSTEEYLIKLFKGKVNSPYYLDLETLKFWITKYYFLFNEKTKKKILFIKRVIKLDISKYI